MPYLISKLQYTSFELNVDYLIEIKENKIIKTKNFEYSNQIEFDLMSNDISKKELYNNCLYLDPNNTVRKKAARLLEKFSEAFPETIYSSVIELLEDDYLAIEWYRK